MDDKLKGGALRGKTGEVRVHVEPLKAVEQLGPVARKIIAALPTNGGGK